MNNYYSTSQMDNFYQALAEGKVKTSGIMNYIQHLFVAQHVQGGLHLLEACCGRGLLIPLLKNYSSCSSYTGIDISSKNLDEARKNVALIMPPFEVNLIEGDITKASEYVQSHFDVIVYTSSIEHMNKPDGLRSLRELFSVLKDTGIMFLSTPNTPNQDPLQHKVHVYEWSQAELENALINIGFVINDTIGLLPPEIDFTISSAKLKYGDAASKLLTDLAKKVPLEFLYPVIAASFPESAKEILYICSKKKS